MAIFLVCIVNEHGTSIGMMHTQSRSKAEKEVERLVKAGYKAFYDQIQ